MNDRRDRALGLLEAHGTRDIRHPGGTLYAHLLRTEEILRSWGADDALCLAGLSHATYGTDGFPVSFLPVTERATLRAAIGDAAEAIVYRYASCDRDATYAALGPAPVRFTDRFAGTADLVDDAVLGPFATLTIANELDLVRAGAFDRESMAAIARLFTKLAPSAPAAAERALDELRPAN